MGDGLRAEHNGPFQIKHLHVVVELSAILSWALCGMDAWAMFTVAVRNSAGTLTVSTSVIDAQGVMAGFSPVPDISW